MSLDCIPAGYGNPRSLRTRRERWQADGTMAKRIKAGAPVIARMRDGYIYLVRDASLDGSTSSREFFVHGVSPRQPHMEPRGRYAGRR